MKKAFKNIIIFLIIFLVVAVIVVGVVSINISAPKDFNPSSGYNLTMSDDVKFFLSSHYTYSSEYAVCLEGYFDLRSIYVTDVSSYTVGDNNSVALNTCKNIGHLHSHTRSCIPSNSDINAWKSYSRNGVMLFMIQCSSNKFMIYTQENYDQGYNYEI